MNNSNLPHTATNSEQPAVSAQQPAYVVGIGEALWDMLPAGKQLGGAPANFAFHVSQFGLQSRVVSAVGADRLGQEIRQVFAQRGLQGLIDEVPYPTGTVQVSVDTEGIPSYEINEGVAWDHIPFTPSLRDLARQTRAVCWGSLAQRSTVSRQTIAQFIDAMPDDAQCIKVFDINLRQNFYTREIIQQSLHLCNVLKINDEELVCLSRMFDYPDIDMQAKCRMLLDSYNLNLLILTCGVNGSYVFTPNNVSFVETPKVDVVDTVGAGDSFTATLVASLLKGRSVREAHERAVRVSAFVCTQKGAMPLVPEELK